MIFPSAGDELDVPALAEIYAYPRARWLRANFVTSADGAAYVEGRSGGLSSPDDMRLFGLLRVLADVVLAGAGTARAEEYKPALRRPSLASLRAGDRDHRRPLRVGRQSLEGAPAAIEKLGRKEIAPQQLLWGRGGGRGHRVLQRGSPIIDPNGRRRADHAGPWSRTGVLPR